MHKSTGGFTIVELIIVIVVVAILATISIVVYRGIQDEAASTALQADLRGAATQLDVYYARNRGKYPSELPTEISSNSGSNFYYDSDGGSSYCLTAVSRRSGVPAYTTSSGGSITQGNCPGHPVDGGGDDGGDGGGDIALTCPTGFIPVPGNPTYGTSDFCVMQYEAKNVGGVATSQAAGTPWVNINQASARAAAEGACEGCKLITDPEWMTIAMNVISNPDNWSGGSVGSGTISRGNSNSGSIMDGSNELSGTSKRTHTLTNGEVVWDLAGNVWEWTDLTISGGVPARSGQSYESWNDYSNSDLQWNSLPLTSRPTGNLYARSQGVGGIYTDPSISYTTGFLRGGGRSASSNSGILSLYLVDTPGTEDFITGFRATYSP